MEVEDDLLYTKDHEWISIDGQIATIGISDYAQEALGDITYIELPNVEQEQELVATFVARFGWHAHVDGDERTIYHLEDQMIRAKVRPGDRKLTLKFEPYKWYHFVFSALVSLSLFFSTLILLKRCKKYE